MPVLFSSLLAVVEPSADFSGLLIVVGLLLLLGVGLALMMRRPPGAPKGGVPSALPGVDVDKAGEDDDDDDEGDETTLQSRRAAKAMRRAARGGIKVSADGGRKKVEALSFPERQRRDAAAAKAAAVAKAAEAARVAEETAAAAAVAAEQALSRERLHSGLSKTRKDGFVGMLGKLFAGKQIDESILVDVEEVLYRADLGVAATKALLEAVRTELSRGDLTSAERVWLSLEHRARVILDEVGGQPLNLAARYGPAVLMVVGVNGSGKTTTIGKLAHRFAGEGRKVLVAAGDTFRAAAVDQLEVWCERAGVDLHRGKEGADPASVCYAAIERAKAEGHDLVICDTAGRLHTNVGLMSELEKVHRVIAKGHAGAPHECLLVLDATMGQNAVAQARQFRESLQVTAIALTKLDGTAKGGVVLAIAETLKLPVKLIGVGEKMTDLRDFDAQTFTAALFERGDA